MHRQPVFPVQIGECSFIDEEGICQGVLDGLPKEWDVRTGAMRVMHLLAEDAEGQLYRVRFKVDISPLFPRRSE